uniref:Uncharacterized protein n=1 Tax=Kalanchoe fedtschenkoi TaxID=63787 RepID=A0A7N0R970_KALFE
MYDLAPLPPVLVESAPMPLVSFPATTFPFWSTRDGAPVPAHHELPPMAQAVSVTSAGPIPLHWPNHAISQAGAGVGPSHWPNHDELLPMIMPAISAAVAAAGAGGSGSPPQAPMPAVTQNASVNFQPLGGGFGPFGSPSAVVLRPGHVGASGPSHLPQPRSPRRVCVEPPHATRFNNFFSTKAWNLSAFEMWLLAQGRRGVTFDDPMNLESMMSPPASALRGPRPRLLDLQPVSRGSAITAGAQAGAASSSRMAGQMPGYSGPQVNPGYQVSAGAAPFQILNSASVANVSTARSVPAPATAPATASMQGSHAHTLKSLTEMLASTSTRRAAAAPGSSASASRQSSQGQAAPSSMTVSTTGASVAPSPSTQGMSSAEPGSGSGPVAGREIEGPGEGQGCLGAEEMAEVSSSAMPDTHIPEADEDEEDKEDDLNDNGGSGRDTAPVAPVPPQPQQQAPSLILARDEASGLEFKQEAWLESSLSGLRCCDFSSTGRYLACAGEDRKVAVWKMGTFSRTVISEEGHDEAIIDLRFKQDSPIFATASFDMTIGIWDATKPRKSLTRLIGHAARVTSVDFHPSKPDILSSCDANMEIRFWNLASRSCIRVTQGALQQVRFQTQRGKYLAAAAGNTINILDSETGNIMHSLKGHMRRVESMCWDPSGRYLASASQDSLHIWSVANWCTSVHKLAAEGGQKFRCCIFHPGISQVVIAASDKNVEIWNPIHSPKTLVVPAHESAVTGLASSIKTDFIATASRDGRVKLWK